MAYVTKEKGFDIGLRTFSFETLTRSREKAFGSSLLVTCLYEKNDLLKPNMAFRGFASKLLKILKNKI